MAVRDLSEVQGMTHREFNRYLRDNWFPGQHLALVGPTGEGKTTQAVPILKMRRYVFAFDPKGGDSTLAASGFDRLSTWDRSTRRMLDRRIDKDLPCRFIVGPVVNKRSERPAVIEMYREVLDYCFEAGHWTVYVDELQVMSQMFGLGGHVEDLLIAARDKGVSVVSSFQAPRYVPRAAADQTTFIVVYYTRDTDVVNRLAEMTGRPKEEIRGAVSGLDEHFTLVFNRKPRVPIIVTKARQLGRVQLR